MKVRLFDRENDYAMLCEWYGGHGSDPTPLWMLPGLGVVTVDDSGKDLSAIFLYMDTTSPVCFAEKMVTCPGLSLRDARDALQIGLGYLQIRAKQLGYAIMVIHAYQAVSRYLKKMGFIECDKDMSCLWTTLKEVN